MSKQNKERLFFRKCYSCLGERKREVEKIETPQPLYQQVYNQIRKSILSGNLKPDTKLSVVKLADELQISRTPLREALRQLQSEGLLEQDRMGSRVVRITPEDYEELCICRLVLEKEIIREVVSSIEEEKIKEAEQYIQKAKEYLTSDQLKFLECNSAFHEVLISSCSNRRLKELLDTTRAKLLLYRANVVHNSRQNAEIIDEHEMILKAVQERNVNKALEAISTHLDNDRVRGDKVLREN